MTSSEGTDRKTKEVTNETADSDDEAYLTWSPSKRKKTNSLEDVAVENQVEKCTPEIILQSETNNVLYNQWLEDLLKEEDAWRKIQSDHCPVPNDLDPKGNVSFTEDGLLTSVPPTPRDCFKVATNVEFGGNNMAVGMGDVQMVIDGFRDNAGLSVESDNLMTLTSAKDLLDCISFDEDGDDVLQSSQNCPRSLVEAREERLGSNMLQDTHSSLRGEDGSEKLNYVLRNVDSSEKPNCGLRDEDASEKLNCGLRDEDSSSTSGSTEDSSSTSGSTEDSSSTSSSDKDSIFTSSRESPVSRVSERDVGRSSLASSSCVQTPPLKSPQRKEKPAKFLFAVENIVPQYCPQAVIDWCKIGSDRKTKIENSRDMTLRAKQHLLAIGWKLWYIRKQTARRELRYTSPEGKTHISLVNACKDCIDQKTVYGQKGSINGVVEGKHIKLPVSGDFFPRKNSNNVKRSIEPVKSQSELPEHSCAATAVSVSPNRKQRHSGGIQEPKRQKTSKAVVKQGKQLNNGSKDGGFSTCKRARRELVPSVPNRLLSRLIDSKMVLPMQKVYYKNKKDGRQMAEGMITCEGIKCNCCQKIFNISKFETHAGSTNHRPAANIFLEDGRSLMQCQKQMGLNCMSKGSKGESQEKHSDKNDYICSICHDGGTLLLCDHCPSAFHLSCLGLEDFPDGEGKWFCPGCRCGVCEKGDYDEASEDFTEKTGVQCDQCERKYHVVCIKEKMLVHLENCSKGVWVCSEKCKEIFMGLFNLVGKSIPVGADNLRWTFLKASKLGSDASMDETSKQHCSKLNVALTVMHECFEPINDPYYKKDVVKSVLFSRWSDLNRLSFVGFYTLLLEREDEVVSVATVRVYGEKVAEVPLVGTRFKYRRQGMCRILMGVLEKKLVELGVERLVLPASSQAVDTWTTSFGFSEMTKSERLKILEYTLLDFPDTILCQILETTYGKPSELNIDKETTLITSSLIVTATCFTYNSVKIA